MTTTTIGAVLEARAVDLGSRIAVPEPAADLDTEQARLAAERQRRATETNRAAWQRECPARFRTAQLSDLDPKWSAQVTEWAENPKGRNLLLAGTVGSGKTHAALAAARQHLRDATRPVTFQVATVVALLDMLRPGYQPLPDEPADPMRRACLVDLLVLDDIGVEKGSDWVAERLSEVIDHRWREERPTIATTNLTLGPDGDLRRVAGERAYSRLVGSEAVVVRLADPDRRRG